MKINYKLLLQIGLAFCLISIVTFLWLFNPTESLTLQAWHFLIIFLLTIAGFIFKPLPTGAISFLVLSIVVVTKTLTLEIALSGFASPIMWLIVFAFILARGFVKTGLGMRIGYYFTSFLGNSSIGLAYGLTLTELFFAPIVPSNTARGAGIVYPIVIAISKEFGSDPSLGTERHIGSYLIKLLYQVNTVTCAMFLTAMVGNPLVIKIASAYGINISWGTWALGAIVPGLINLILLPIMVNILYPPLIKKTPGAREFAKKKLIELGSITKKEKIMIAVFTSLIFLWIGGDYLGINATTSALIGVTILLVTRVLDWDDVIKETVAWDTFIWMAVLVTFSMQLSTFGITDWFSGYIALLVKHLNWALGSIILALIYFYIHYFFASITARISSLLGMFLGVCITLGSPPLVAALCLAYLSCLGAGLTHYGTSIAPIYFSSGYVTIKDWWRVGGIISICNFLIWLGVGSIWWKILGYW